MFDRIKCFFREIRIDLDFPRYERQQRDVHEKEGQIRFTTEQLNIEKVKLLKHIETEANSKFNVSLNERKNEKKQHEEAAKEKDYLLSFFLRNYKEELNDLCAEKDCLLSKKKALYDGLSGIKKSLSEAFDDKNKAYSELNHHKDRIDSWYAKSDRTPLFFGNAGKKIPKHSLFGQSLGDLNSDKYHRDSAYGDVRAVKSQIGDLKQEQQEIHQSIGDVKRDIGEVFAKINQVKNDRSKMFELKNSGHHQKELQKNLDDLLITIGVLANDIQSIAQSKNEFITQEKHRHGVVDLEAKIRKIEGEKVQFLSSFDSEENKQNRKLAHKEIWLKHKGAA